MGKLTNDQAMIEELEGLYLELSKRLKIAENKEAAGVSREMRAIMGELRGLRAGKDKSDLDVKVGTRADVGRGKVVKFKAPSGASGGLKGPPPKEGVTGASGARAKEHQPRNRTKSNG